MISHEMGLSQLTSNKCMIFRELYLFIPSASGDLIIFSNEEKNKHFPEAFLLLNMKSKLLKPDLLM